MIHDISSNIEREIGERARAAKLKLRFEKVVRRHTGDLKATLAGVLPEGRSVVITVTAPIKHPAKTAEALENILRDGPAHGELCKTTHGNKVRVRRGVMERVMGIENIAKPMLAYTNPRLGLRLKHIPACDFCLKNAAAPANASQSQRCEFAAAGARITTVPTPV